jgi:TolB-like protein/DNA-binding SARP family transcriptional activator
VFSLKLFGGAILEGPDGPVGGRLAQRRRMALLAILALGRGRPISRDKILGLLWPETDAERARHSLADSVYHVRKALGDHALVSAGDDLVLNAEVVATDVQAFEDSLGRGDPEDAVAHYRGPLLDGFHLDDAPEFERWCDRERDRLARAYTAALEQLADEAGRRGDVKAAAHWWHLLIAADPYNARFVLRLMATLEQGGDRAGAIQQGRSHAALMETDVGAPADQAVIEYVEQLTSKRANHPRRAEEVIEQQRPSEVGDVADPVTASTRASSRVPRKMAVAALGMVVVLAAGAGAALSLRADARATASTKTIAVLPCANLSQDKSEEYFSDGLTEELIAVLSQLRALRVVARTSVFEYKDRPRDIREVGKALNVGTVLECSVRRVDDRVRVTAQLITAADGFHLWAESYEREGTDILAIQNDLALRIVGALQTTLSASERELLARRPTTNQAAHALYLRGQYFWNQRTTGSFERALQYFEEAIALDSQYARAYAGLARTYSLQGLAGVLPPAEAGERMRRAAEKAIALEPALAEAYAALGVYLNLYAWKSVESERAYRRAIELDPDYGDVRHYYANFLTAHGRHGEALRQREKGVEVEPLSAPLNAALGSELMRQQRGKEGVRWVRDALEFDRDHWHAHARLGNYFASIGQFDAAIRAHRQAAASGWIDAEAGLARVLALDGKTAESKAILARLVSQAEQTGNYPVRVASVFVALNDINSALNWLERAYEYRNPQLRLLPLYAPELAASPQVADLLRRIGLPVITS